ncbi:hypothetical protein LINPERPRIM_LOCUS23579 [Linum perenne]
MREMDIAFA